MAFRVLFPADFEPEDWGWVPATPYAPEQRVDQEAAELERFGFVSKHWLRWEIPFRWPASLARLGFDEGRLRYFGLYLPSVPDRGAVQSSVLTEELMRGRRYGQSCEVA